MLSTDEMNILNERAEKYLRGESKTYTVEESHAMIRDKEKSNEAYHSTYRRSPTGRNRSI
jgi:hypothetical protein